jgi:hypothetical protein
MDDRTVCRSRALKIEASQRAAAESAVIDPDISIRRKRHSAEKRRIRAEDRLRKTGLQSRERLGRLCLQQLSTQANGKAQQNHGR